MSTEAMKLALAVLENINSADNDRDFLGPEECCDLDNALTALQEALAQPRQEPVAWIWKYANGEEEVVFVPPRHVDATHIDAPSTITPLYTSPPARKPLTKSQVLDLWEQTYVQRGTTGIEFARAIEAAHGIKEST